MHKISERDVEKLQERMNQTKKTSVYRRLQAVALRGQGKKREEIAEITGFHIRRVGILCKIYCTDGIEGLERDRRNGGNHRNMSDAEEKAFLEKFIDAANAGQIITVEEIAEAYDKAVGKKHESLSTVYSLLHKHGWRKIVPKQYHPGKASDEEIEASKKLTLSSKR